MSLFFDILVHTLLLFYATRLIIRGLRKLQQRRHPRLHPQCGACQADLSAHLGLGSLKGKTCPECNRSLTEVGVLAPNVLDEWTEERDRFQFHISSSVAVAGYLGYVAIRFVQISGEAIYGEAAAVFLMAIVWICLALAAYNAWGLFKHYDRLRHR